MCPGKRLLIAINDWLTAEYGIQITVNELNRCLHAKEVDGDFKVLIGKMLQNCAYDDINYLRDDLSNKNRFISLYKNKRYQNNFYSSCYPVINSNLLYINGAIEYPIKKSFHRQDGLD